MGKPAARIGDDHECPKATPGAPPVLHVGGPVIGPGCLTVLIEGMPAARVSDNCFCVGEPDTIATGSSGVFIGGLPAARMGDSTEHGGKVITGCGTVLIGAVKPRKPRIVKPKKDSEEVKELTPEEKNEAIEHAIAKSIVLLEKKLNLLLQNDPTTLNEFMKWFGKEDEEAKVIILQRIRRALEVSRRLTRKSFEELTNEKDKRETCAIVYSQDDLFRVKIGAQFWEMDTEGMESKAGTVIHELSHHESIGPTEDVLYGEKDCLYLARIDPEGALKNADSFQYFVVV